MITGFNASSTDPEIQLNAYAIASHGNRPDAVQSAAARFIRGEVEGHKANRCPTVAEFAKECRSEHSRFQAKDKPKSIPYQSESREFKDWRIIQRERTRELERQGFVLTAENVTIDHAVTAARSRRWPAGTIWFWCLQEAWSPA